MELDNLDKLDKLDHKNSEKSPNVAFKGDQEVGAHGYIFEPTQCATSWPS